jgi:hypothetical protein
MLPADEAVEATSARPASSQPPARRNLEMRRASSSKLERPATGHRMRPQVPPVVHSGQERVRRPCTSVKHHPLFMQSLGVAAKPSVPWQPRFAHCNSSIALAALPTSTGRRPGMLDETSLWTISHVQRSCRLQPNQDHYRHRNPRSVQGVCLYQNLYWQEKRPPHAGDGRHCGE